MVRGIRVQVLGLGLRFEGGAWPCSVGFLKGPGTHLFGLEILSSGRANHRGTGQYEL